MFGLVVDGVDDHEGEVSVVDLLLERLDERRPVAVLHLLFVIILENIPTHL
jgi:hypothetical protein